MNNRRKKKQPKKPVNLSTPAHPTYDFRYWDPILHEQVERGEAKDPKPRRDWDAMDDLLPRWSREAFEDALVNNSDPLKRDHYSTKKHLAAWDLTEELHQWARENNPGYNDTAGLFLFSGPMGSGKSLSMGRIAWEAWAYQAIPVLSNMSLRFGYQVSGAQIYSAMDRAEPGTIVVLDEIAALMDSFSGGSNRGRTLTGFMTAFRKKQILMLVGSANEQGIHPDIRRHARGIITPRRINVRKRLSGGGVVWAKEGELPYPKFCYQKHIVLKEPWERNRITEDALRLLFHGAKGKELNPYKGKLGRLVESLPGVYNIVAACSDTLDRVPSGDAYDITRDTMTADRMAIRAGKSGVEEAHVPSWRELQRQPSGAGFLTRWVYDEKDFKPGGSLVKWKRMTDVAERKGVKLTQAQIQRELRAEGVNISKDGIKLEELLSWVDTKL